MSSFKMNWWRSFNRTRRLFAMSRWTLPHAATRINSSNSIKCFYDDTTRADLWSSSPNRHAVPHYGAAVNFNRNLIFSVYISVESSGKEKKTHIRRYSNLKRVQFLFQNISFNKYFSFCSDSIFRTLEHMLSLSCSTPRNHMLSHCKQLWWWVASY